MGQRNIEIGDITVTRVKYEADRLYGTVVGKHADDSICVQWMTYKRSLSCCPDGTHRYYGGEHELRGMYDVVHVEELAKLISHSELEVGRDELLKELRLIRLTLNAP